MIEAYSQTWQTVKKYAEDRITELRTKLEGQLGVEDTLTVRAQLKELRLILELPERDIPLTEPVDTDLPG